MSSQPVVAEVAERHVLTVGSAEPGREGLRDQDLATVARGADARRAMDVDADLAVIRATGSPVWMPIRTRT